MRPYEKDITEAIVQFIKNGTPIDGVTLGGKFMLSAKDIDLKGDHIHEHQIINAYDLNIDGKIFPFKIVRVRYKRDSSMGDVSRLYYNVWNIETYPFTKEEMESLPIAIYAKILNRLVVDNPVANTLMGEALMNERTLLYITDRDMQAKVRQFFNQYAELL